MVKKRKGNKIFFSLLFTHLRTGVVHWFFFPSCGGEEEGTCHLEAWCWAPWFGHRKLWTEDAGWVCAQDGAVWVWVGVVLKRSWHRNYFKTPYNCSFTLYRWEWCAHCLVNKSLWSRSNLGDSALKPRLDLDLLYSRRNADTVLPVSRERVFVFVDRCQLIHYLQSIRPSFYTCSLESGGFQVDWLFILWNW